MLDADRQGDSDLVVSNARRSEDRYRALFDTMDQGVCVCEMLLDQDGRPVDYRFLEVNQLFAQMTGLHDAVGKTAREMVPNLEDHWFELYGRVALTGEPARFVNGSEAMGRWFEVGAFRVGDAAERTFAILFTDITQRRRTEEALREAQERFRTFADTAPAMLWVTEPDGWCSFLSRGWFEFTGQTEATALGFGWLDAVHPEDREAARAAFLRASQDRVPYAFEDRLRTADGSYRWVIDAGRPRIAGDGSFLGFIGSVIDIDDRKRAEERLEMVVNSSGIGLWYCDLPFDELIWNDKVREHFGLPPDARVTIDTFYDRLHPEDRERARVAIEDAIQRHAPYDIEYRTIGRDGRQRWIRAIGQTTYQGDRPIRFDGITLDVTERLMQAEALREADRLKDEFLATLAHELRNPLAPLRNGLEIIRLARDGTAVERAREMMERQLGQMVRLVDDLLDVSRISKGKLRLRREPALLATLLRNAVETSRPLLDASGHALSMTLPDSPLYVDADVARLSQVFANLLNNAAKYTPPGGRIAIHVTASDEHAVVSIRDNGIGIPPEMLPRVFEMFTQVRKAGDTGETGLGLGLTIVEQLVRMHGGSVEARSGGEGQGSEFIVTLPRLAVTSSTQTGPPAGERSLTARRILVVDDNHDSAFTLAMMLELMGHETETAHDGRAALIAAERYQPDTILLDIGMPDLNGYEVAVRLRQQAWGVGIILIALTGWGQDRDKQRSHDAGFDFHLVKPVEPRALQAMLAVLEPR